MKNLVGKNILIVDEVDDTRTTLEYAVRELQKDVETARKKMGVEGESRFGVFVLHVSAPMESRGMRKWAVADEVLQNKDKPKKGQLPTDMIDDNRYIAAKTVGDVWICYPWEATYVLPPLSVNNLDSSHLPSAHRKPQANNPQRHRRARPAGWGSERLLDIGPVGGRWAGRHC